MLLPLLKVHGVPLAEARATVESLFERFQLSRHADQRPAELSGGQQQRVAIARAHAGNPSVILADEPTGNLDSHRSHEIMQLLQALNRVEGITIVMVTHEEDIAAYARRLIVFTDGRITRDEAVKERA